jgi:Ca2+-binding EF-hand superfamily protein
LAPAQRVDLWVSFEDAPKGAKIQLINEPHRASDMMGGGMMQMFDADGDGTVTPEELRTQLQASLTEYDGNGDGSLSIAEFEILHSAMIREAMVDRFQYLDANGDGAITAEEMTAPATKMERMNMMRAGQGQMQGQPGSGQVMGNGTMMNDN